jgi:hypothetical protein
MLTYPQAAAAADQAVCAFVVNLLRHASPDRSCNHESSGSDRHPPLTDRLMFLERSWIAQHRPVMPAVAFHGSRHRAATLSAVRWCIAIDVSADRSVIRVNHGWQGVLMPFGNLASPLEACDKVARACQDLFDGLWHLFCAPQVMDNGRMMAETEPPADLRVAQATITEHDGGGDAGHNEAWLSAWR